MDKFILYLGLNDKDTKKQMINLTKAQKLCTDILMNYTDGATISKAKGLYRHDNGYIVTENTLRIELLFITNTKVKRIATELKRAFNQESIAVQHEVTDSILI